MSCGQLPCVTGRYEHHLDASGQQVSEFPQKRLLALAEALEVLRKPYSQLLFTAALHFNKQQPPQESQEAAAELCDCAISMGGPSRKVGKNKSIKSKQNKRLIRRNFEVCGGTGQACTGHLGVLLAAQRPPFSQHAGQRLQAPQTAPVRYGAGLGREGQGGQREMCVLSWCAAQTRHIDQVWEDVRKPAAEVHVPGSTGPMGTTAKCVHAQT